MPHIITKGNFLSSDSKGIAFVAVLIFLFVAMSVALLFFFRNTIISMREFREKERLMRVQYGKNAAWSMAYSKIENYFFAPNMWKKLNEPPREFPQAKEEYILGKNFFQFTIRERNKPLPIRYRIESETLDTTSTNPRLAYRVYSQVWDGNKWSPESSRGIEVLRLPAYNFFIMTALDLELFSTRKLFIDSPIYVAENLYISSNDTIYISSNIYAAKEIYYGKKERYTKRGVIYIHNGISLVELDSRFDSVEELPDFHPLDLMDSVSVDGKPFNKQTWREDQSWYEISDVRFKGRVRSRMNGIKRVPFPPANYFAKQGPVFAKAGVRVWVREVSESLLVKAHYERRCKKHTFKPDSTGGCGYYDARNPCCEWDSVFVFEHHKTETHLAVELEDSLGNKIKGSAKPFTFVLFFDPCLERYVFALQVDIFELQDKLPSPNRIYYFTFSDELTKPDTILGIRFIDGEILLSPIFLASDYPVYIYGNFNRHADGMGRVIDPRKEENFENDRWNPAFVAAKTITLLSSSYSDENVFDYSKRTASGTEYSFIAITSSPVTSKFGAEIIYGGGFENIFRLVENWKDARLFFWGSIIMPFGREPCVFRSGEPYFEPPVYVMRTEPYISKYKVIPNSWSELIPELTLGLRFYP